MATLFGQPAALLGGLAGASRPGTRVSERQPAVLSIPVNPPRRAHQASAQALLRGWCFGALAVGSIELLARLFGGAPAPLLVVTVGVASARWNWLGGLGALLATLGYGVLGRLGWAVGAPSSRSQWAILMLGAALLAAGIDWGRRRAGSAGLAVPWDTQARLNAIFEHVTEGLALLDREGVVRHASRSTQRLLGYERATFVGHALLDWVHPEDRAGLSAAFARCVAQPGNGIASAFRLRDSAGQYRHMEGVCVNHLEHPQVGALVLTYRDESARRHAETVRRRSEGHYRRLFERSLAGVYLTTLEGRILDCNQALAEMLGYASPRDLVGRMDWEFHPEPRVRHAGIERLRRAGSLNNVEIQLRRRDDSLVWVLGNATLVDDVEGEPLVEGTLVDIERIKRAEQQARELNRLKTNFMVVTSHELRTPLTVIRGYNEMLIDGWAGALPERPREMLRIAQTNVDRIIALLNDIARLLAVDDARLVLTREAVDVAALLHTLASEVHVFVERRRQHLRVDAPLDLPPLLADRGKLGVALRALLENAIKFTPDGGAITLRAAPAEDEPGLLLSVSDTGVGIDARELQHVFERFYAGANPDYHSSGRYEFRTRGVGLGLAIAKGYVEAHGGRLWAESAGADRGSTFFALLPQVAGPANTAAPGARVDT
jgi:PAS domain S-box-containing protein